MNYTRTLLNGIKYWVDGRIQSLTMSEATEAYKQMVTDVNGDIEWADRLAYKDEQVISWDGNLENQTYIEADGFYYVHLSNITNHQQFIGGQIELVNNGQILTEEVTIISNENGYITLGENIVIVPTDNFIRDENTPAFPKAGIYFTKNNSTYAAALRWSNVKQLDESLIPNTIARTNELFSGSYNDLTETPDLTQYYLKTEADTLHTNLEEYVDEEVAALVNATPETLDTIGEIAAALQENKEVIDALDASITNKQNKISDTLILVDTITGAQHKIQIQNGQLVSFPVE